MSTGHPFYVVLVLCALCGIDTFQTGPCQPSCLPNKMVSCLGYHENVFMSSILRRKTFSVLSTTINKYIHKTIYTYVRMYVYTYIHKTINTQGCNAAFMYIHKTIRMYIRMVPQKGAFVK